MPSVFCRRPDFAAHLDAKLGVEIGQRLVEQEHVRPDHHRACDRDTLQLAARELVRPARRELVELHQLERDRDPLPKLLPADLACPQPVGDVVADVKVGEHRIVLEHHAGVAPVRRQGVDALVAEQDAAAVECAEPRHHAQQRSLAAAGRAEQGEELAVADRERDVVDRAHGAERARDALDRDRGHGLRSGDGCIESSCPGEQSPRRLRRGIHLPRHCRA